MSDEHATKPSELAALLAEIEENRGVMPHKTNERTHWLDCWRTPGHHNCAVAMVERLAALWKGETE